MPGFQSSTDVALFTQAGAPEDIVKRLSMALIASLKAPEVANALTRQGTIIIAGKPEQFPAYLREESAKWSRVVKSQCIKAQP